MVRTKNANVRKAAASTSTSTGRNKGKGPQVEELDTSKFIHVDCQKRFRIMLWEKDVIPEKLIQLSNGTFRQFERELERRQWSSLLEEPHFAGTEVVREFYANMLKKNHAPYSIQCVYVRGKWVNVGEMAINRHLRAPTRPGDEYFHLLKEYPDWEEVRQTIGVPDSVWTYTKMPSVTPKHLENRYLNDTARVWTQIMFSRILPNSHTSSITVEHCIMLYCLMTGKDVNLGKVISEHMEKVQTKNSSLPYPSLITAMAISAGVVVGRQEARWPIPRPITEAAMLREFAKAKTKLENERRAQRAAIPSPPASPAPVAASSSSAVPSLLELQAQIDLLRIDRQHDRNMATRQFSLLYSSMQRLDARMGALMSHHLPPEVAAQYPPIPPMDPALQQLISTEGPEESDAEEESETAASDDAEDMEEDASEPEDD